MRKNGVNRELVPIDGGVCAPEGFLASGVRCGIANETSPFYSEEREDLALIVSETRVPTACAYASGNVCGACVKVTKKHLQSGYAGAVIVNGGVANAGVENGEKYAETICRTLEKRLKFSADEIVIASTGAITGRFPVDTVLSGINALTDGLGRSHERSLAAARAIMTADSYVKQLSFSFTIGDYACKIGAIFKGSRRVCPNMATTLCFLTTDVNISPEMLQKALSSVVNDAFNMLNLDGASSPNDTVCIMANGKAGNYRIDCADSEYKKFCYALGETALKICKTIAADGDGAEKAFVCKVVGAKSKNGARRIAKSVAGTFAVKAALSRKQTDRESLVCAVLSSGEKIDVGKMEIFCVSERGKFVLMEEGKAVVRFSEAEERVLEGVDVEIRIDLHDGNYSARSIGCV